MKKLSKIGLGLVVFMLVLQASCLYTRIDEQMIKRRGFQSFKPKEYIEPTKYLNTNGVNYAYIEKGQGPTVILMHGGIFTYDIFDSMLFNPYWDAFSLITLNYIWPARAQSLLHFGAVSTIDTWQYNFNALAEKFNVIALDLPGFGNSSKPDIRYTVPEMTQLLNQFITAKGLNKVYLVGQDYSGLVAIDFALTYPDKVAGLVLVSPYGAESHPFYYPIHLVYHYPRWIARHMYRDKAARVDLYRNLLNKSGEKTYQKLFYMEESKIYQDVSDKVKEERLIYNNSPEAKKFVDSIVKYKFESGWMKTREFTNELYAAHMALTDVKRKDYWGIIAMRDDNRSDWITRMRLIKAPTLIIRGKFDPLMSYEDAQYMDEVIPNSNLDTYVSSAHYPMVEEPSKFNQDLIQFISGVSACQKKL